MTVKHPAKFSDDILRVVQGQIIDWDLENAPGHNPPGAPRHMLLDPFAGIGRVHALNDSPWLETIGYEIEPEWAKQHPLNQVQDSRRMPLANGVIDIIATSPTYGNRMADSHKPGDKCSKCDGTGDNRWSRDRSFCKSCDGSGLSKRMTYTHTLGRELTPGNSGGMNWGPEYRKLHVQVWRECRRVLRSGGLFVLNISDHIRKGEVVPVTAWHVGVLERMGFVEIDRQEVETRRMGFGANANKRVEFEAVIAFRRP